MSTSQKERYKRAAIKAWKSLHPNHPEPKKIVVLKSRRKSSVYRLEGVGPLGESIIAKLCKNSTVQVERTVYQQILPHVPYPTLQFYGTVPMPKSDLAWLFVEDANGVSYANSNPDHRSLGAEWLATLQSFTSYLSESVELPERGKRYYRKLIKTAHDSLAQVLVGSTHGPDEHSILEELLEYGRVVERNWSVVTALWDKMPRVFVHNGFYGKNVHISERAGRCVVMAFDWESAGWGVPALDISREDIVTYWSVLGNKYPRLDLRTVEQAALIGKMFWVLKAVPGEASVLSKEWDRRLTAKMASYLQQIASATKTVGWSQD